MMSGDRTPLSERLGSPVSTYSAYVPDPKSPDRDSVLSGLTQVNSSGMVSLGETTGKRELWVKFTTRPVNTTGAPLTEKQARDALSGTVNTHQDVPAIQAMLQSIRIN